MTRDDLLVKLEAVLACYSGTGFSAELSAVAASNPGVMLVDLDRLYQS